MAGQVDSSIGTEKQWQHLEISAVMLPKGMTRLKTVIS
jgi:hypothetical protein